MRPDVAIVSLGTTFGWRHADAALHDALEASGCTVQTVPVRIGAAGRLRRTLALTDLVEAVAARHAAARVTAPFTIFSSITAALLASPTAPYAVRFDTIAALSRPGWQGAWQRRRERRVLADASLLLPWSEPAARAVAADHVPSVVLPVPIEPLPGTAAREDFVLAYGADPRKRGLDLLCAAWGAAALPKDSRLLVAGLPTAPIPLPPGAELTGPLARADYLHLLGRARLFVNASRFEDWGIAALEAMSAGTPLVSVPSAGPYEALPLARALAPALVAAERSPAALAEALRAGWSMSERDRRGYAARADAMLAPYRPEAVARRVAEAVVPVLRRSSW